MKSIVLAGGCFWGMEQLFRDQSGVKDTEVGYAGNGSISSPTYEHHTGYAEALLVRFDERETSYEKMLDYFFQIHDPTYENRQGNDIGDSYRSAIFFEDEDQRAAANQSISRNQVFWERPIVTKIEPLLDFAPAEKEHQDFLRKHPGGYSCHFERPRR